MTKTIHHYRVEISDGTGIIKDRNEFKHALLQIIGENERYMVVNDQTFTTLDKENGKYSQGRSVGKPEICICTNDSCWGNRITYSLYSFTQKKAATIRKEIEREIQKKLGFFLRGVNLDIVHESKLTEVA